MPLSSLVGELSAAQHVGSTDSGPAQAGSVSLFGDLEAVEAQEDVDDLRREARHGLFEVAHPFFEDRDRPDDRVELLVHSSSHARRTYSARQIERSTRPWPRSR